MTQIKTFFLNNEQYTIKDEVNLSDLINYLMVLFYPFPSVYLQSTTEKDHFDPMSDH